MKPDTFNYATEVRLADERVAVAHAAVADCGGIVGAAQLAGRWGLSKARIGQLTRAESFPAPLAGEGIPRWLACEADAWNEARNGGGK